MDEKPLEPVSKSETPKKGVPIKSLILFVACCGAFFYAYKTIVEETKPNADLVRQLRSSDESDRVEAVRRLGVVNEPELKESAVMLLSVQSDPSEMVRVSDSWSMGLLAKMAVKSNPELARELTEAISKALGDKSGEVRGSAAEALYQLSMDSTADAFPIELAPVISGLVPLLADSSEITRRSARKAIVSLGSMKALAPPPALIDLLSQGKLTDSRAQAATALGAFGDGAEGTVKALILALKDSEPDVRNNAAVALQSFGPGAAPAFPGLIALLDDPFIPPPPPTAEMPISKSASTGGGGGGGGGRGQQAAQPAKTDPPVEATRTIGRTIETQIAKGETPSPEALAGLAKTLKASRPAVREAAQEALKRIGKGASALVPALIQELTGSILDPEAHFGPTAATALGNIAPGSPTATEAIAALVAALDAKAPETQSSAVVALGRFGTSGSTAIPRLKEVSEANPSLASSIKTTIDRLEGKAPPEAPRRKGGRGGGGGGGARKKAG